MAARPSPDHHEPITVLVVDDHPAVRAALCRLLESQPGVRVVGTAVSVAEARSAVTALRPEVTLLDISMPGTNGLDAVPQLKHLNPGGRVVMYSLHDEPAYLRAALRGGADGYVVKDDPNALLDAVSV
ncbi:MAG TPA: response regulator transcription factor [Gaiellales bacterium]|jgi:DNA-binding NarL/FixJ family response regulator